MATSAKVISGNLRIKLDDKTIFHATEATLSLSREVRERATKDTLGIERAKGTKDWTCTSSALGTYDADGATHAWDDLFELYDDDSDTTINIEFVPDEADATFMLQGLGIITQLDMNANNDEDATASITIIADGKLNKITLPVVVE